MYNLTVHNNYDGLHGFFGKGGFLSRLGKLARGAASLFPGGAALIAIIDAVVELFDGSSTSDIGKLNDDEASQLSPSEYKEIDDWDLQYFTPFYLVTLKEVSMVLQNNTNINVQLEKANLILNKCCAVKSHFITNPTKLSPTAFKVRTNYIARSLIIIEQFIIDQFGNNPKINLVSVKIPFSSLQLSSIIKSSSITTVNCTNYKAISNDIAPVTAGTVVVYDNTTGINPKTENKSSFLIPAIGIGVLALAMLSPSKSK